MWRVLVRREPDTDKWEASTAFLDREKAMGVFLALDEVSDDWDVMLVKEERFSSATESMGAKESISTKDIEGFTFRREK